MKATTPVKIKDLFIKLSKLAIRAHYYCDDSWYSCPKSPDGCANKDIGIECNCGADNINKEIKGIMSDFYLTYENMIMDEYIITLLSEIERKAK